MNPSYPSEYAPAPTGINSRVLQSYPDPAFPAPPGYSSTVPPMTTQPTTTGYPPPGGDPTYPVPHGYPSPFFPEEGYPLPMVPMTTQPTVIPGYPSPDGDPSENWVQKTVPPFCPPGLEYLNGIDQLLVHQKVEMLEVCCGCETKNKYSIKNSMGQNIYAAKEDTDCCTRNCWGAIRPFDMKVTDNTGNEVIHFYRALRCACCCCPCCLQEMEIYSPPDTFIGRVTQEWSIWTPKFSVQNADGETVLRIRGPICVCGCRDINFKVFSSDGATEVGKITKQWSGLLREAFTSADHFGISFPMDLDVNMKAVLLGALFLIDFMFFEKNDSPAMNALQMFV